MIAALSQANPSALALAAVIALIGLILVGAVWRDPFAPAWQALGALFAYVGLLYVEWLSLTTNHHFLPL